MRLRHIAADAALIVIVCVAAMFLHPIAHGPYSAVHGPTTALRALYQAWAILTAMALAATSLAARLASSPRIPIETNGSFDCLAALFRSSTADPCPLRC